MSYIRPKESINLSPFTLKDEESKENLYSCFNSKDIKLKLNNIYSPEIVIDESDEKFDFIKCTDKLDLSDVTKE